MRRAISQVLFVLIVAGLVGVLVKASLDRKNVAADTYATYDQSSGLYIARPPGMTNFPEELVPLP
jgi:hypothetical protein